MVQDQESDFDNTECCEAQLRIASLKEEQTWNEVDLAPFYRLMHNFEVQDISDTYSHSAAFVLYDTDSLQPPI